MSGSQCKVADWGRVGFSDGSNGESENQLAAYTEDCAKVGVQPNAQAYRRGWDTGIVIFCTAANAWREGLAGNANKDLVCQGRPGHETFTHYLDAGLKLHRTKDLMRQNAIEMDRLQKRLDEHTSDEERRHLHERLHDLALDQHRLRSLMSLQQMAAP
jgi:hypothetical protein